MQDAVLTRQGRPNHTIGLSPEASVQKTQKPIHQEEKGGYLKHTQVANQPLTGTRPLSLHGPGIGPASCQKHQGMIEKDYRREMETAG